MYHKSFITKAMFSMQLVFKIFNLEISRKKKLFVDLENDCMALTITNSVSNRPDFP